MRTDTVLALVVIRAADLAASERFYAALGLAFTRERHGTGPEHLAAVLPGGAVFEVYPRGDGPGTAGVRLGFRVPSVAGAVAGVTAVGGTVVADRGTRAVVADPDGHRVELTEGG